MSEISSILRDVLTDAASAGLATEPAMLLAALRAEAEPLTALARTDGSSTVFNALEQELGFIRYVRATGRAPSEDSRERWAALIRWLFRSLREWRRADDERFVMLGAVLTVAHYCSDREGIWRWIPDDGAPSVEFVETVGRFVAGRRIEYRNRGIGPAPIWESEFVERFRQADGKGDWAEISELWPRLEQAAVPDSISSELVRCLSCHGFDQLVHAADALPETPTVMWLVNALPEGERLRLALACDTARVRFCCAYATLTSARTTISPENEDAFCALLGKVAVEPGEWRAWMKAFNTYPQRYPALHGALGKALAGAPLDAADAYIESVQLRPLAITGPQMDRPLVAEALRSFARGALLEHRKAVWTRAYRRWRDWCFDKASDEAHLLEIHYSALDFAIVSYVVECLSVAERDNVMAAIVRELNRIELAWHATETDCITEWNRLLSAFQPYAHATIIASHGADALAATRVYWPFDVSNSLYHRIMFRVNPVSLGSRLQSGSGQDFPAGAPEGA